jgi:hypothetical protein
MFGRHAGSGVSPETVLEGSLMPGPDAEVLHHVLKTDTLWSG